VKQAVNLAGMRDSGILKQIEELFKSTDVVTALTKLINVWEIQLTIKRNMAASIYGNTPLLENRIILVFDVIVYVHRLIVLDVA
jgi:hypothetical protein